MRNVTFKLSIDGTEHDVRPIWGDTLQIALSRVTDYRALRERLEGQLVFAREDYDLINAQAFDQQFWLTMTVNDGAGPYERLTGYFFKTYLEDNRDQQQFTLQKLVTADRYEKIINGINQEFNLPTLGVERVTVNYKLQPLIQIYTPGADLITNVTNGNSWEQPVAEAVSSGATLISTYFFQQGRTVFYIPGRTELDPDVGGEYFYDGGTNRYIAGDYSVRYDSGSSTWNIHDDLNGGVIVYTGTAAQPDEFSSVFTPVGGSGTTAQLYKREHYLRVLTNAATFDGSATNDLPSSDIVSQSNYTKAAGLGYLALFGSDENSTTPTQYGQFSAGATYFAGDYFEFPINAGVTARYWPVNPSAWEIFSVWIYIESSLQADLDAAADDRQTKDAYKYADVLNAVLQQLDPNVVFAETTAYSDFLFGESNPIRTFSVPILCPKTQITVGDYDLAAKKAPITLKDLLDLAKTAWSAYWHLETDGKFRIEHVSFYENGKSYGSPGVLSDLTSLLEPNNRLPWSYGANVFKYDLGSMPERIEKAWQEEGSLVFDGVPTLIRSQYVNPGTVEKQPLSRFYSDVDFALANEVIKDGLFYLECEQDGSEYNVSFVELTYQGKTFNLQNGKASFVYLEENFGGYDMPAEDITLNGEDQTAQSVRPGRETSVGFAGVETSVSDYMQLITVNEGNGLIESAKIQVATGILQIETLKLPTQ